MPPAALPSSRSATSTRLHGRGCDRGNGLAPCSRSAAHRRSQHPQALAHLFGSPDSLRCSTCSCRPTSRTPTATVSSSPSDARPADRDYYLKGDPQLKALRGKYVAYIGRCSPSAARATLRPGRATSWRSRRRRRSSGDREAPHVEAIYNPPASSSCSASRHISWQAFLEPSNSAPAGAGAAEYGAIHDLAELFNRTAVTTLQAFLTFHYLSSHAQYLPRRFDEARFAFYGQSMRGQPQQRERWKRGWMRSMGTR